jgi:hypothetical protein
MHIRNLQRNGDVFQLSSDNMASSIRFGTVSGWVNAPMPHAVFFTKAEHRNNTAHFFMRFWIFVGNPFPRSK